MKSKNSKNNNINNDYGDFYNRDFQSADKKIYSNTKKKKSSRKKIFNVSVIILSVVFAITGAGLLYAYNTINSFNYVKNEESSEATSQVSSLDDDNSGELKKEGSLLRDPRVLNVMLYGLDDQSAGDGGRTDTMLMLSIDNRHKKLKLTTFMRDIWVQIPDHGEEKLNAAFAFGGAKLSIETIERTFGINIDRYAMCHFDGFADIVDALGGIDMEITASEAKTINELCDREGMVVSKKLEAVNGVHHLNGFQALNHARNRDSIGSDFDRTKRQRDVLSAIIEKSKHASLPQIISLINTMAPKITMNFTKEEIAKLASNSLTYVNYSVEEFRLPENNNYSDVIERNGAAALEIDDISKARYDLAKFLYEDSVKSNSNYE